MASDMFIKLDGIKGECQDKKWKDQINVLAWSWGASNTGTSHYGSGSGAGRASFQGLSVTKYLDKSSPILLQHCTNGKHIASGQLCCRKAGGTQLEYLLLDIKDVMVTSYSTGGTPGEDVITENITLDFAWFGYKYIEQTPAGAAGATPEYKYDIAAQAEG